MRAPITTHILDTQTGKPAADVAVVLSQHTGTGWQAITRGETNADGRVEQWQDSFSLANGVYKLEFAVADYFNGQNMVSFYPEVTLTFNVDGAQPHYHVPLLLSAYGYTTYRGS